MLDSDQHAETDLEFDRDLVGDELSSHLTIRSGTGSPRTAVLTARALRHDHGLSGWVGTLADITAEAEAAAAMVEARDHATEASRLKSDFLANMSHEIRTPMTTVMGWAELLLDTDLDDDQRGFALTLSRAGETLLSVINAILDFSKIERGQIEVENLEFEPQTVVDDVVGLLTPSAQAKDLALGAELDDSVPAVISGDPRLVGQVLTNLVSNAIKFTQAGEVAVRVSADSPEGLEGADTLVVRFEVSDTGVGIPADKLAMIFEPFTQEDTTTTRKYGGTGLGLAISSRLTGLMGGEVGVTSEVDEGSTFWFTIDVRAESAPDHSTHVDAANGDSPDTGTD